MTIEELKRIADDFLSEHYGMTLDIPIERNNRFKIRMGQFVLEWAEDGTLKEHSIALGGFMFEYAADSEMVNTLLHECVHYAMFKRGLPYEDGTPEFEAELARHGIGSTETNFVGKFYVFECESCGEAIETNRQAIARNPTEYYSGCCRATLRYVRTQIYDGTEVAQ